MCRASKRARLASLLLLLLVETDSLHVTLASRGATRLLGCARRPTALVMDTNTREGVMSRGHPHTVESRLKISMANKGKAPWNVGKKHSEETKRKIAERTKAAYLKRKEESVQRMKKEDPEGYAAMLAEKEAIVVRERERKEEKAEAVLQRKAKAEAAAAAKKLRAAERAANAAKAPADRVSVYSDEVREKISEGLRKRWRDPAYRASRNYTTSEATKRKLSAAMKAKWQDGSFRKRNTVNGSHTPERRAKIAASVKRKWAEDGEYRNRTVEAIRRSRNITIKRREQDPEAYDAWRTKISESMKSRWAEPDFRQDRLTAFAEGQGKRGRVTRSTTGGSSPTIGAKAAPRKPRATPAETAAKRKETSAAKRRRLEVQTRKREEATAVRQNAKSNAGFEERLRAAMGTGAAWSAPGTDRAAVLKPAAAVVAEEEAEEEEAEEEEAEEEERSEEPLPREEPPSEELALEEEELEEDVDELDDGVVLSPRAGARGRGRPAESGGAGAGSGGGGGAAGAGMSPSARGGRVVAWGDFELELGEGIEFPVDANEATADSFDKIEHWMDGGA